MEGWALVEIMGHKRFAGRVSEENVIGVPMLRIDVPVSRERPGFIKYFAAGAIYGITPMTEEATRTLADALNAEATDVYIPYSQRRLPGPTDDEDEDPPHDFVGHAENVGGGCNPCTVCGLERANGAHTAPTPVDPPEPAVEPVIPAVVRYHDAVGDGVTCSRCGRPWGDDIHEDMPF